MGGRQELTSLSSTRVKAARRLARRSARDGEGRFLVEGPRGVLAALSRPETAVEVFATAEALRRHPQLAADAVRSGVGYQLVSPQVLTSLAQTVTPQGVIAVCKAVDIALSALIRGKPLLLAMGASVRDPGNLGTLLRCADAAGAEGLILTGTSVDVYNSKAVRASAGSLFHLPVAVVAEQAGAINAVRAAGLRLLAADAGGDSSLYTEIEERRLGAPTAWLFGNEAWGLPGELTAAADAVVRIPIHGRAESLNLATAAAICLYASARAQRSPEGCRSGDS